MNAKHKPFKNLGPGFSIRRDMEANGWNQKDLAEILGFSEKHLSRLLNNKEPITMSTARLLSKTFSASPQFWLNLDANYRASLEDSSAERKTAAKALIYRYMPIRDMRSKGWIPKDDANLASSVKEFWHITDLKFDFIETQAAACFRKSDAFDHFNPFYALTWLRKARIESEKSDVNNYDKVKLEKLALQIPEYSLKENGAQNFVRNLKAAGVKFLCLPHLEKTYIDGASFLEGKAPVIAYTARHDRIDNFWFTITHEIAHVLLHLGAKTSCFLDNIYEIDETDSKEKEANSFTGKLLKSKEIIQFFKGMARISKAKINECSCALQLSQPIIVGCLQHHKIMPYSSMRDLLPQVKDSLTRTEGESPA